MHALGVGCDALTAGRKPVAPTGLGKTRLAPSAAFLLLLEPGMLCTATVIERVNNRFGKSLISRCISDGLRAGGNGARDGC